MKHKYGAKRCLVTSDGTLFEIEELKRHNITDIQGETFDSKMEAEYYLHLITLQAVGRIAKIELQPKFILQDKPKITYVADSRVTWPDGKQEIIDVKGVQTQAFRLKAKLFRGKYPYLPLTLVTRKGRMWHEKEVS